MTLYRQPPSPDTSALESLRWRWTLVALFYATIWLLTYYLLQNQWQPPLANRWRLFSAALALLMLGLLWRGLPHNRRNEQSQLWPTFGLGNWLSLVRGILLCLLAGFLFLPRPTVALTWLPALLYTTDRITDLFDGYLARRTQRESKLGAMLDIELDGLGLLLAVLLGVQYGLLPAWYLLLAVSRQLFVAGLWLRTRMGQPNRELPPSDNRRVIAGFQTGFLAVMLWPLLPPAATHFAAVLFAIPLIYSFGRDWLVVSYLLNPAGEWYSQQRRRIKLFFESWLPMLARLVGTLTTFWLLWPLWWQPVSPPWFGFSGWGWSVVLTVAVAVAALALFLGFAARIAALCLLAFALLSINAEGLLWSGNGLLFASTIIVAHLGGGRGALWQPEEYWLHTQFG